MYEAVIFDFDYTLGDSTNGIVLSANYALAELGYTEKPLEEIKRTIGLSLKETFRVLTRNGEESDAAEFARLFRMKADEVMTENTVLYGGAKEMLSELGKRGIKTGIVTTKFHYRIDAILRKFGAEELVSVIIGGEDVAREKPDPEGLLNAIELLGIEKCGVLYVGDSTVDAKTAQSAGVDFAAVLTGTTRDFSEYDNVFISENLYKVLDFVTKI